MKKEIYKAAVAGNVEFLEEARAKDVESGDSDLLGLTSHGNNIIHVAVQHDQLGFIVKALQSFHATSDQRNLICGKNSDGDTPLHFAAKLPTQVIAEHLIDSYKQLSLTHDGVEKKEDSLLPWRVKNKDGNTPLHVALMNGGRSIQVAAYLLKIDPQVAAFTNNRKEVPLHLAVTYDIKGTETSTIKMINTLNSKGAALTSSNILSGQGSNSPSFEICSTSLESIVPENEDNSVTLVRLLLKENTEVCCLCDADGMTPLLRAAINSNLPVVEAIITDCPESIEVRDPKGKNMLHYIRFPTSVLAARKLLEKPEIPVLLIEQQDHDGNTPMHVAVMNHDLRMVKAMVRRNANFAIKNKEGVSAQSLFDQFVIDFQLLQEKEDEKEQIMDELMSYELYIKAGRCEWDILRQAMGESGSEKLFVSQLPDGSNIIHMVFQLGKELKKGDFMNDECSTFIVDALKKFPVLLFQTNHLGQTPLHTAMMMHCEFLRNPQELLFRHIKEHFTGIKNQGPPLPPWKAKDVQGNTLLHVALSNYYLDFAKYLIDLDESLVGEVNYSKETPLHLHCATCSSDDEKDKEMVKLLHSKDISAVYSWDIEGRTPLMRAASQGQYGLLSYILVLCPQSLRRFDPQGRNIFHYSDCPKDSWGTMYFFAHKVEKSELLFLIKHKDHRGNTSYELAIQQKRFWGAIDITRLCKYFDVEWCLDQINKCESSLGTAHYPDWFQNHLKRLKRRNGVQLSRLSIDEKLRLWAVRSSYGVKKAQIKDYMSPMSVVAALLATVTFTAAFTVPGGYKGDTGIPNLGKKVAFQVFLVSDVVGMCSSMMVLFCLLWFLQTTTVVQRDDKYSIDEEVVLVDTTISLLLLSFYATVVAFMSGIYVTTVCKTPWVAIFTCLVCSLLLIIMRISHIKRISIWLRLVTMSVYVIRQNLWKKLSRKLGEKLLRKLGIKPDMGEAMGDG